MKPPRSPTIVGTAVARIVASIATRPVVDHDRDQDRAAVGTEPDAGAAQGWWTPVPPRWSGIPSTLGWPVDAARISDDRVHRAGAPRARARRLVGPGAVRVPRGVRAGARRPGPGVRRPAAAAVPAGRTRRSGSAAAGRRLDREGPGEVPRGPARPAGDRPLVAGRRARDREFDDARTAADYLACFRGDSIVADAEHLRATLYGGRPWATLGQSYGGFLTLTYLSRHPEALTPCFVTGGLPPATANAEYVYRHTYRRQASRNRELARLHPADVPLLGRARGPARGRGVRCPTATRSPRSGCRRSACRSA